MKLFANEQVGYQGDVWGNIALQVSELVAISHHPLTSLHYYAAIHAIIVIYIPTASGKFELQNPRISSEGKVPAMQVLNKII